MLEKYRAKRNFNKTREPKGSKNNQRNKNIKKDLVFVVQKHHAKNLHWDFRLEYEGVLLSWAVPKGVPVKVNDKRLAIQTEDHPLEYADFEGEIPEDEYGAGKVKIEDRGTYQLFNKEKDLIDFKLNGNKYKGKYILVRPKNFKKNNYLLFRKP